MAYANLKDPRLRAARRKHYADNKEQYKRRNAARLVKAGIIIQMAKNRPCMDCGVKYPHYVMDFDHRDPSKKRGNVGQMARYGMKALEEEIAKCDVVCANCHRERTHGGLV